MRSANTVTRPRCWRVARASSPCWPSAWRAPRRSSTSTAAMISTSCRRVGARSPSARSPGSAISSAGRGRASLSWPKCSRLSRMRRSETAGPSWEISSTPTLLPSCPRCSCASTERSRCDAKEVSVSSPRTTSTWLRSPPRSGPTSWRRRPGSPCRPPAPAGALPRSHAATVTSRSWGASRCWPSVTPGTCRMCDWAFSASEVLRSAGGG